MQYLRARYYAADMGVFTSADSYGGEAEKPLSQNRYLYANGDPVNYFDPGGDKATSISKAAQNATKAKPTNTSGKATVVPSTASLKPTSSGSGGSGSSSGGGARGSTTPAIDPHAPLGSSARTGIPAVIGGNSGEKHEIRETVLPVIKLDMQVFNVTHYINRRFCSADAVRVSPDRRALKFSGGEWGWFISLEEIEDAFNAARRSYLKDPEWELFKRDPLSVLMAIRYGDTAKIETQVLFGGDADGKPSNAFLHAYWNTLMAYFMDYNFAKEFATAHEYYDEDALDDSTGDGKTYRDHANMDLHNNAVGRIIGNDTLRKVSNGKTVDQLLLERFGSQEKVEGAEKRYLARKEQLLLAVYCLDALNEGKLFVLLP